jgi:phosphatidate cytidylyltransferase
MKRVLTAAVMIPAAVGAIFGPPALFLAVAALLAALCYYEYAALITAQGGEAVLPVALVAGLIVLVTPEPFLAGSLLALVGMCFAMRGQDLARTLITAGGFALGLLYVFGAWRAAIELKALSPHWVLFACGLNWLGDTAAMYVGKAFGRHKLAPRVSPGKTVEGAVASLVASAAGGVLYVGWALPAFPMAAAFGLAVAGNVAGQLGDLAESALKRGAGVKDSGHMLPGHGGILDRMDSSLFSMPMVLGLLRWIG